MFWIGFVSGIAAGVVAGGALTIWLCLRRWTLYK